MNVEPEEYLFNIQTPLGFRVRCTYEYWQRKIVADHPVMVGRIEAVIQALAYPVEIRLSRIDESVYLFYAADGKRLVCAVARQLNGDGYLITAYPADKMKQGTIVWTS